MMTSQDNLFPGLDEAFPLPLIVMALPLTSQYMLRTDGKVQLWKLTSPFAFVSKARVRIDVPEGYVTNFASVPQITKNIIDDDSPHILQGSVIHDYLYTNKGVNADIILSRHECDDLLVDMMLLCGADEKMCWLVKESLTLFGGAHWGDV